MTQKMTKTRRHLKSNGLSAWQKHKNPKSISGWQWETWKKLWKLLAKQAELPSKTGRKHNWLWNMPKNGNKSSKQLQIKKGWQCGSSKANHQRCSGMHQPSQNRSERIQGIGKQELFQKQQKVKQQCFERGPWPKDPVCSWQKSTPIASGKG